LPGTTTASRLDRQIERRHQTELFVPLGSLETPDKNTLVLRATQPWPAVFNVLAWTNILDPQVPPEQNKPAGTGPFTFVEWVQGDHFTLKKNPNYWQSGKPYLDGVEIKIFADP
jgi:ABC-type transport system substrate-binding protein